MRLARTWMVVAVGGFLGWHPALAQSPFSGEGIRLNGYSSLEFEYMIDDVGRGDPNGSFDADLIDVVLNWQLHDRLRVAADLTWEHGTATEDGFGNAAVEYAWFEVTLRDWARIRGGKMFTPFGIYNEIHTAKPVFLTVKEPLSTNKTDKFGTDLRLYPRWGTGLELVGNGTSPIGDWDYALAVTNGFQESTNPHEEDDNKAKAFAGRARLLVGGQLEVGASFYRDRLVVYDDAGDPTGEEQTQLAVGAQLTWELPKPAVGLELEWVSGALRPDAGGGRDVWSNGATAMVWWNLAGGVTPYVRFEWLDPDTAVDDDVARLYIVGVNLRFLNRFVVKAEWDVLRADTANARFDAGRNQYSEIKAAAVVGF